MMARLTVSGLESGATWEYTTDGGTTWSRNWTSFTLLKAAMVRMMFRFDKPIPQAIPQPQPLGTTTVDQTITPLSIALANDTGTSGTDHITNDGQVTVSGLESGATWEYTTDGGTTWKR